MLALYLFSYQLSAVGYSLLLRQGFLLELEKLLIADG
jgi:hypothetical protein